MMEFKTKSEFDEIIEQLNSCLGYYEKSPLNGNRYRLFLANGDGYIDYTISDGNIPHLLGVDTTYADRFVICKKEDSYQTLGRLIDYSYNIWRSLDKDPKANKIFSGHIKDKIEVFRKQLNAPYANNIEFICKYDRTKNYDDNPYKADYFIARKNEQGDILLLGLVKLDENDERPIYCPQTSMIIRNDENFQENLSKFLSGQEITYASGLVIRNGEFQKNTSLNTVELNNSLTILKSYMVMANAVPVTIEGHIYNIQTLSKNKQQSYTSKNIYTKIQRAIISKELISLSEEEKEELEDIVLKLIKDHNDYMIATETIDASKSDVYTGLEEERDSLRQELLNIKNLLQVQKEENERLMSEIENKNLEINSMMETQLQMKEYAKRILQIDGEVINKKN